MTAKNSSTTYSTSLKKRFKLSFPILVGLFLTSVGIIASALFSDFVTSRSQNEFNETSDRQMATIAYHLQSEVRDYQQLLRGAAAMYNTKRTPVTQEDWREYVTTSRAKADNPALLGIGYTEVVRANELTAHEQSMRAQGYEDYVIRPSVPRDIYSSIIYLEPSIKENREAVGYDMYFEPSRRAAMESARDTASFGISAPVNLIQDPDDQSKSGVLMYHPVYAPELHPTSMEDRRAMVQGYVYVVFRPRDIMATIDTRTVTLGAIDYEIKDGESILDSHRHADNTSNQPIQREQSLDVANRHWSLAMTTYQPSLITHTSPAGLFVLGILASMGIGGLVTFVLERRVRKLSEGYRSAVRRTKNELLALTSHQLRTPATGVKQYVGLLRDGLVGDITPEQQVILDKAYAANERQLETIEQLLYVAKADANQLRIKPRHHDVGELASDIVEEMRKSIEARGMSVAIKITPRSCASIDRQLMRMAIENLISNAAKYSPPDSTIHVSVVRQKDKIEIRVRDHGVGIAPEDMTKLFVKFSRVHNPLSQSVEGSGLGLFLVRKIVRAHKGSVDVESTVGRGSTFILRIDRKKCKKGDAHHDDNS